jgi:hypothetical protein
LAKPGEIKDKGSMVCGSKFGGFMKFLNEYFNNCVDASYIKWYKITVSRLLIALYIPLILQASGCGCSRGIVGGGLTPKGTNWYECPVDIKKCNMKYSTLKVTASTVTTSCQPDGIGIVENWADPDTPKIPNVPLDPSPLYCDRAYQMFDVYKQLRGATLIRLPFSDQSFTGQKYLTLLWAGDIDNIYVAYDSRAINQPNWLKEYFIQVDDCNNQPCTLITGIPDLSQSTPHMKVKLNIWKGNDKLSKEMKTNPQAPIILGGNSEKEADWPPSVPASNRAMYIVLIKPKEIIDLQNCKVVKTIHPGQPGFCEENEKEALKKAKALAEIEIAEENQNYQISMRTCTKSAACEQIPLQSSSFTENSKLSFQKSFSSSKITLKLGGEDKTYTSAVGGDLHFNYDTGLNKTASDLLINSLALEFDPVNTDAGKFENITLVLLNKVEAKCGKQPPFSMSPCDNYKIDKHSMIMNLGAMKGKEQFLFTGTNDSIDVNINHKTKSLRFTGGPIKTTVKIDGKDTPLEITLDVIGEFTNFAPKAQISEFKSGYPCGRDSKNSQAIYLSASSSFDIYNPQPLTSFEWYENYGLVAEKLWGNKANLLIPPHSLGFGVHYFTVVVRDDYNVEGTATVPVVIDDLTSPILSIPPDIYTMSWDGKPIQISIGKAKADDNCYFDVGVPVSNDAPRGGLFSPGVTQIHWLAEDGKGNYQKAEQSVYVLVPAYNQKEFFSVLAAVLSDNVNKITLCEYSRTCRVRLATLNHLLADIDKQIKEKPIINERDKDVIIMNLRLIREHVKVAEFRLRQSDRSQKTLRSRLLNDSLRALKEAYTLAKQHSER